MHLDSDTIQLFIVMLVPITGIVGGILSSMVKKSQQHREEMARIQASSRPSSLNSYSQSDLSDLRQEIASLRDTTTQYDLSVERNMHEMMRRLQAVEARTAAQHVDYPSAAPENHSALPPHTPAYAPIVATAEQAQPSGEPLRLNAGS